jgi:methionine-rich copper-binding protein CopC
MTKLIRIAVIISAFGVLVPRALDAHAMLTRAEPGVDGHVTTIPARLRLWFSEAPEIAFTTLTLADSGGGSIALGKVEKGDTKLEIRAPVAAKLARGRYTVSWRTAGPDGHATSGTFRFTVVAPPAPR